MLHIVDDTFEEDDPRDDFVLVFVSDEDYLEDFQSWLKHCASDLRHPVLKVICDPTDPCELEKDYV